MRAYTTYNTTQERGCLLAGASATYYMSCMLANTWNAPQSSCHNVQLCKLMLPQHCVCSCQGPMCAITAGAQCAGLRTIAHKAHKEAASHSVPELPPLCVHCTACSQSRQYDLRGFVRQTVFS